jgi:hypothetical protein
MRHAVRVAVAALAVMPPPVSVKSMTRSGAVRRTAYHDGRRYLRRPISGALPAAQKRLHVATASPPPLTDPVGREEEDSLQE